jgi:transposase
MGPRDRQEESSRARDAVARVTNSLGNSVLSPKLDSVISDIVGLSGRRMIEALIAGETDPNALAALAHRRIKASPAELEAALRGRVTDHHRFMLRLLLQHIDALTPPSLRSIRRSTLRSSPFALRSNS